MSQAQRNSRGGIRKPTGGLRRWYRIRQLAAFVLSVTMVLCNVGNSAAIALAGEGSSRIVFGMEAENIWEAAKEALEQGEVSPVPAFGEEDGAEASKYRELFGDGMLFDITQGAGYTALPDVEGVDLQVFVRIKEGADPQTYRLSGEEDLLFLYINGSSREVTASVEINGESMGTATVKPYREAFGAGEEENAASDGASAPESSVPVSDSGAEDVPPSDGGTENAPSSDGQTEDALPSDEGTENVSPSDENRENAPSPDKGTENAPSAEEEAGDVPPSDEGTENAPSTDEETKGIPVSDGETKTAPESDGEKGDAPKSDEGAKDIPKPDGKTENVPKPDKVTEEASAPDREDEDTQKPDERAENTGNPSADKDEQPSRGGQEETPDNSGTQDKADEADHTEDKEGSGSTEDAKKHEKEEHTENTQEKGRDAGKEEGGSQDRAKDDADEGEKPESGREEEKPASGDSDNREKEISMSPNRVHTVAKAQTDGLGLVALEDGTTAKVLVISLADTGFVPEEAPEGVPEDIPAEVKAFLDAVAKIPEEITEENAEEVGALLYGEAADALEALLGTGYEDREDVQAAMAAMEEAGKAVDEVLGLGAENYYTDPLDGYTAHDIFYYYGQPECYLYLNIRPKNFSGPYTNPKESLVVQVYENGSAQRFYSSTRSCPYCGCILHEETPEWIAVVPNKSEYFVNNDSSIIKNEEITWSLDGYVEEDDTDAGYGGLPALTIGFKGIKPGKTALNFYVWQEYFYKSASGYCRQCWNWVQYSGMNGWVGDKELIDITVNADYLLEYDTLPTANRGQTVADTKAAFTVTSDKPQLPGSDYEFLGWAEKKGADKADYKAGDQITLNWESGFGSSGNPVKKTLYPVWKENGSTVPPTTDPVKTYTVTYTDGVAGKTVFPDQGYEGLNEGDPTPAFVGTPEREGWTFEGWMLNGVKVGTKVDEVKENVDPDDAEPLIDSDGNILKDSDGNILRGQDITYVAQWKENETETPPATDPAKTYTVTYTDGVAGETVFPDQGYEGLNEGDSTPAFVGTPEREGWTFKGWEFTNAPEKYPVADSEDVAKRKIKDEDADANGEILYTAIWEKDAQKPTYYTVIYTDGVDGDDVFVNQETSNLLEKDKTPEFLIVKEDGTKVCGNPTREGYTFKGWKYTNNSGEYLVTSSAEVAKREVKAEDADENRVITYTATWEEKPITGSLIIRKTVSGDGMTEDDKKTDFVFEVELYDKNGNPLPGEYHYIGDKNGTIRNGGTVSLRHGQMVVIEGLPLNTEYTVWEKTDHMKGYDAGIQTGSKVEGKEGMVLGCTGTIEEAKEVTVHFINRVKSEPEKPTDPVDPTDPVNPTDPADPTDPEKPTDPVDPTNPADPTDPVNPTDPEKPTDPVNPTDPEKPTVPEKPTDPVNPTDPEKPTDPVNPTDPAEPTDSETPRPVEPGNPSKPDVPESPADNPTENPEENTAESPTETAGPEESSSQENPEETTAPTEPSGDPFVTPRPSGGGGGGGGGSARERNTSVTVSAEPSGEAAEEPTVEINPEDVPLADLPSQEQLDEVMIHDEEVPLFGLPKTGDGSIQAGVLLGMALISLLSACGIYHKKREKDE